MSLHAFALFFGFKVLPFIYAIVGFGALIAIHECGHFMFCKLFGIHTPTFSIGFGPELFRKQIGKTNFRLAAIPLGGYVEIAGLAEVGQGDQEHAGLTGPESFDAKPYWQKLLTMAGGILFNLLFAYIVFCFLFMFGTGEPRGVIVGGIVKESAAETAGLKSGDAITHINDQKLLDDQGIVTPDALETLLTTIRSNPNQKINLTVERKGDTLLLPITLGSKTLDGKEVGSLGAEMRAPIQKLPFFQAIKAGIQTTNRWIVSIILSIKQLFTQRSLEGAGGPVMIMSMSFGAAQQGILALLVFLALISINLALINILPIGALDGGQILFITIEAIIGRKLPVVLRNGINLASWVLLLSLAVFLTYRDIVFLFGKKLSAVYHKLLGLVR